MNWYVSLNKSSKSWFSLYSFGKNKKKSFNSTCKMMKVEVVLEDVGVRKNGVRM